MHTAKSEMKASADGPINSLGFAKPRQIRVVVAMSGGVDPVTAALLHDQGYM